jgi:hypothetical protein
LCLKKTILFDLKFTYSSTPIFDTMHGVPMSSRLVIFLSGVVVLFVSVAQAQDSLSVKKPLQFTSIGFQASFVSGIGVSYGLNELGKYRFRVTGGIITAGNKTHYSFGLDYQFELTKENKFRVFIGPGFGSSGTSVSGNSESSARPRLGLGIGAEAPVTGTSVLDNISGGVTVYYPTYFFVSKEVSFAGGVFISYNF